MALNPCVKQILCALSAPVLAALNAVISSQIALLRAQIVAAQAQLLALDITTAPLELARNIAQGLIDQAKAAATLVPFELIAECADLGDFNVNFVESLDALTADLNDIVDDLQRLLSFKEELQLLVNELEEVIEQFEGIQAVIEECATT